jgi:hypothetical protein
MTTPGALKVGGARARAAARLRQAVLLGAILVAAVGCQRGVPATELKFSDFTALVEGGEIRSAVIAEDRITGELRDRQPYVVMTGVLPHPLATADSIRLKNPRATVEFSPPRGLFQEEERLANGRTPDYMKYSQFVGCVERGEIKQATVREDAVVGELINSRWFKVDLLPDGDLPRFVALALAADMMVLSG